MKRKEWIPFVSLGVFMAVMNLTIAAFGFERIDRLEARIAWRFASRLRLEARMDRLEARMDRIELIGWNSVFPESREFCGSGWNQPTAPTPARCGRTAVPKNPRVSGFRPRPRR